MTRTLTRHLTALDEVAHIAAHLPVGDLPLAWANRGVVYVNLPDAPLTPDATDALANAMHTAAEEARK